MTKGSTLPFSYVFTREYGIGEFNLANTYNYAKMASLIALRTFMAKRTHNDAVGIDAWVAYEFAKVRRFYASPGIPDYTAPQSNSFNSSTPTTAQKPSSFRTNTCDHNNMTVSEYPIDSASLVGRAPSPERAPAPPLFQTGRHHLCVRNGHARVKPIPVRC